MNSSVNIRVNIRARLLGWMLCGCAGMAVAQAPVPEQGAVSGGAPVQAAQIGSIEQLNGSVSVTPAGEALRQLRQGDPVREGDLVVTGANSETLIKLRDETTLALRQNSQLRLSEFRFERTDTDSFTANLLKGALRKVSGLLAKARPRNVLLRTPTATIGIRGTDFEVSIIEEESPDIRAGTYDYVYDGATAMQVATGESLDVSQDETGLALANPRPGEAVLQLIRGRPAFLRGGGFDSMMLQISRPPIIMMPGRR